jgi:hypothetical protein
MIRGIRERVSDGLLRTATELAFEQRDLERSISTVSPATPGHAAAQQAVWLAEKIHAAVLWLGWRLQPRTFPPR